MRFTVQSRQPDSNPIVDIVSSPDALWSIVEEVTNKGLSVIVSLEKEGDLGEFHDSDKGGE